MSDARLRKFDRRAFETGALEDVLAAIRERMRSGAPLDPLLSFIPPELHDIYTFIRSYTENYQALLFHLNLLGIPFELRPDPLGRCGCENMACVRAGDHRVPSSYCADRYTHEHSRDPGLFGEETGICIDPTCQYFGEVQWTVGECSRTVWKIYEDQLGGFCGVCADRMPLQYHSHVCNCSVCGSGVGPHILLRSQLASPKELQRLLASYRHLFPDDRTVDQPFTPILNIDPEHEAERRESSQMYGWEFVSAYQEACLPRERDPYLDTRQTCLIEVRPNKTYRLRTYAHLNEKHINVRYFEEDMRFCNWISQEPEATNDEINTCQLLNMHYFGRDFLLWELTAHLTRHRTKNLQELAHYVVGLMSQLEFPDHQIDQFYPLDYRATLIAYLPRAGRPITVHVKLARTPMEDTAKFHLPDYDELEEYSSVMRILSMDTRYRHPWASTPEKIMEEIHQRVTEFEAQ